MKPKLLILIVAYFADRTIQNVVRRIPPALNDICDTEILVLDDGSSDQTFAAGVTLKDENIPLKLTVLHNPVNQGYGGNQKIGYHYAITHKFDLVVLLHGDGQYAPEILPELVGPLVRGEADAVLGSRMINPRDALKGGMPLYKFVGNRILTSLQNWILGSALSEFHSGYRAYSVRALADIPYERNSNVFHFDTEVITQLLISGKRIKELPIPTYYGDEISRVNGLRYAFDVMKATVQAKCQRLNIFYDRRFDCAGIGSGPAYPSKLDFPSSHSRVLDLVAQGARVLDLGAGLGSVGAALKTRNHCRVIGCDLVGGPATPAYDAFLSADLNDGLPPFEHEAIDTILALDVIEHLQSPEAFLDSLRLLAARKNATVIVTTANIAFILMRVSLLCGRFEYGKRGILDLTHARLFTKRTLIRALTAAGFVVKRVEGVVVPWPFVFRNGTLVRLLLAINGALAKLWPSLFGFQLLAVCEARPTLESLLQFAVAASERKLAANTAVRNKRR